MVHEIAEIDITPGREEAFLAAVREAAPLFQAAKGCRAMRLERGIETPGRFRLVVDWETIEDHMVGFRESPAYAQWRALVGGHFAAPPRVEHSEVVFTGF